MTISKKKNKLLQLDSFDEPSLKLEFDHYKCDDVFNLKYKLTQLSFIYLDRLIRSKTTENAERITQHYLKFGNTIQRLRSSQTALINLRYFNSIFEDLWITNAAEVKEVDGYTYYLNTFTKDLASVLESEMKGYYLPYTLPPFVTNRRTISTIYQGSCWLRFEKDWFNDTTPVCHSNGVDCYFGENREVWLSFGKDSRLFTPYLLGQNHLWADRVRQLKAERFLFTSIFNAVKKEILKVFPIRV